MIGLGNDGFSGFPNMGSLGLGLKMMEGNQSSGSIKDIKVIFDDAADSHLTTVKGFNKKKTGIQGGHSKKAFDDFAKTRPIRQVGETRYGEVEGIYEIDYQVAKLERGKPVPNEWVDSGTPYKKTLYDDNIISEETIKQLARKALSDSKPFSTIGGQIAVQGSTLYKGKLIKFEGWLNSDGTLKSYYPVLDFSAAR